MGEVERKEGVVMGRKGSRVHQWTGEDEGRLLEAIKDCEPLLEHYSRQGYGKSSWWDAVAGRLLPEVEVTGGACKRRWERLSVGSRTGKGEEESSDQVWEDIAEKVGQYERDLQESMYDDLLSMGHRIMRIQHICEALFKELTGLDEPAEGEKK